MERVLLNVHSASLFWQSDLSLQDTEEELCFGDSKRARPAGGAAASAAYKDKLIFTQMHRQTCRLPLKPSVTQQRDGRCRCVKAFRDFPKRCEACRLTLQRPNPPLNYMCSEEGAFTGHAAHLPRKHCLNSRFPAPLLKLAPPLSSLLYQCELSFHQSRSALQSHIQLMKCSSNDFT